jgi:hypothetical protein
MFGLRRSRVNANSLFNRRNFARGQRCQDHGAARADDDESLSRRPKRRAESRLCARSRRWRLTTRCVRVPERHDD